MDGPGRSRPLVLVADDDADIRALVAFSLERAGYEVASAEAGADDYVKKPFSPQELRDRVKALLGDPEAPAA